MNSYALAAALAFASITALGFAQPGSSPPIGMMGQGMGPGMMGHGMMTGSMIRHHQAMMYGIPERYRSAQNPLAVSAETLRRGAQVYFKNCAACHGARGHGDGPAA